MLEITILGGLKVSRGGAPITGFQSDKVRALLVYLAVESERPKVATAWDNFAAWLCEMGPEAEASRPKRAVLPARFTAAARW
jgi:hypothetical protein